ncbi:M20/M25/M40 family metallo-hydrolase [Nonomuraea turkmeniaca]|uniref:M20/M25/M40 family metallo-hydrolase n=1 Tax=Nonomuraea turkmeniaca TaxID=103838 RepID=A0A5S4FUG7_9ACTN|nr:M28 family metallopeptidase [Nonomuraea turkmeniaca]TMR24417.1 M20/M25/M40 family metallo-hydrolase [Nonomuraea turkmeniaca]
MHSGLRKGVLGAITAVAVAVSPLAFTGTASAHGSDNAVRKLVEAVSGKNVKKHLSAFQAIADANGGTRVSGTPGFDASRDYVARKLRGAGYDVTIQPFEFTFDGYKTPPVLKRTSPDPKTYSYGFFSDYVAMGDSPAGAVSGTIQPVDLVLPPGPTANSSTSGCEASDFAGFVPGNIALMQRGTCNFRIKVDNAMAAGAAGVIVFNEGQTGRTEVDLNPVLSGPGVTIPSFFARFSVGQELAAAAGTTVQMNYDPIVETRTTYNVIAQSKRGNPDNVVMLGAHLDSVQEGPGINDNGSGSAGVLEVALQAAKIRPKNQLRFAFWGAEEFGLLGSEHYVAALTAEERAKITLYLNFDMIASPNYTFGIYDGDGDAFGVAGPPGSDVIEEDFEKFFAGRGQPYKATAFTGRSDYGPFIEVGIPAGGLFTGAEVLKTAEEAAIFGGTAGVPLDPCYHSVCDTIKNINDKALDVNSDAIAALTAKYAFNTGTIPTDPAPAPAARSATAHTHTHKPADSAG